MLEPVIKDFLSDRKEVWLKKQLNPNQAESEQTEIYAEAEVIFSFAEWLPNASKRAKQLNLVSHPAKFTHPGAKTSSVIAQAPQENDGFLRFGNVKDIGDDVFGNAAAIDVYKFLSLKLLDGKSVLQHIEHESELIQKQFSIPSLNFESLREQFLLIKQDGNPEPLTSGQIKQVYFPVADEESDYHLLSILNSSGMMFALKDRINQVRFSDETKQAREDRKNKVYNAKGLYEIYDLTAIGFGGTQPQNISVLNSSNGGVAFLLKSMPPELDARKVRLPKNDFFKQTLWVKDYGRVLSHLNYLLNENWRNDMDIRQKRDQIFQEAVYQAAETLWQVRAHESGWSNFDTYSSLPAWQKIWLDNARQEERETDDIYIDQAIAEFAKWFIKAFEDHLKKSAIVFNDVDIQHFINVTDLFDDHTSLQIKEAFR
ncbi:MAG: type I-F CRISPR-associated protein Csy1 [Methyloprofundus sp.]|nr:type I-F CRISPR-associated protein Csy1 [Methyloprofundus sp.]